MLLSKFVLFPFSKSVFTVLFSHYYVRLFISLLTFSFTLDPKTVIKDRIAAEDNNQYTPPKIEKGMELPSFVTGGLISV